MVGNIQRDRQAEVNGTKDPVWVRLVEDAISYDCLEMITQRAYPYVLAPQTLDTYDLALWRGAYISYKKWQKVLVNPRTINTIVPTLEHQIHMKYSRNLSGNISCVSTFDKYIAVAFEDGLIASYIIDNINQPFYLANHGTRVIQTRFWYSNGDVLVVSVGEDYYLKFWDLQNKIEVATNGFFAKSLSIGECRHFCIGDMENTLTSYGRVGNHISPGPTLNLKLKDNEYLIAYEFDGKYMTAITLYDGGTAKRQYLEVIIEDGKLTQLGNGFIEMWDMLPKDLHRLIMTTTTFFFGIGENNINFYYDENWWEYDELSRYFRCNVKSIALHAQILMFGLEDGSIHLINITEDDDVYDLEGRIKLSWMIEVDTEPIVDLMIMESNKKPCIVAVTAQKVHLINFF